MNEVVAKFTDEQHTTLELMDQTVGRRRPLSSFMELLLFLISMACIVPRSQYPSTEFKTLASYNHCCDGSLSVQGHWE